MWNLRDEKQYGAFQVGFPIPQAWWSTQHSTDALERRNPVSLLESSRNFLCPSQLNSEMKPWPCGPVCFLPTFLSSVLACLLFSGHPSPCYSSKNSSNFIRQSSVQNISFRTFSNTSAFWESSLCSRSC